ncbi:MAG TPA: hypothetical protein VEA69_08050 [Tepidisphaeraceae bacterium]|nr:hypothetical protein [Tepidisphaeraceae bacterium]
MAFLPRHDEHQKPDPDPPTLREFVEDDAYSVEAEALAAHFVADDGVELVLDLAGGGTGAGHLRRLEEMFETWWAAGRPRLPHHPHVIVSPWVPDLERQAHRYLDSQLPPGATYSVNMRRRRVGGGGSEDLGWYCQVEDGPASSGGKGTSPLEAARAAVSAWRAFVTGGEEAVHDVPELTAAERGAAVPDEEDAVPAAPRPPLLEAPSRAPQADQGGQADRKVS